MIRAFEGVRLFYNSKYYPAFVLLLVFLGSTTGMEFIFCGILVASVILGLLICRDLRFFISPLLTCIFMIPLQGENTFDPIFARYLGDPWVIFYLALLSSLLIAALTFFCIRNRRLANPIPLRGVFLSMVVFCVLLFFNGAFSENYTPKNLAVVLLVSATMLISYILLAAFLNFDRTLTNYFVGCLAAIGVLICAQMVFTCLTHVQIVDGKIVKETMILGWGSWANIGNMLLMLMPACFYFAVSGRRGWIGYLLGLMMMLFILISQSRGALLCGCVTFLGCIVYLCLCGENRKKNRIYTAVLFVLGCIVLIFFSDKLLTVVRNFMEYGLFDNGRFELWEHSWDAFLRSPIFGSGFYDTIRAGEGFSALPRFSHNTVLQLLGSCGVLGIAAYLYHRAMTVKLFFVRFNHLKFFMGMSILGFLLFGMLDVPMFTGYPNFYYSLMLLFMLRSENRMPYA